MSQIRTLCYQCQYRTFAGKTITKYWKCRCLSEVHKKLRELGDYKTLIDITELSPELYAKLTAVKPKTRAGRWIYNGKGTAV